MGRQDRCISRKLGKAKPEAAETVPDIPAADLDATDFATPITMAKSECARKVANLLRRARVDYEGSKWIIKEARRLARLSPTKKPRRQPRLLTADELRSFFAAVDRGGDLQHRILLRLALYTGLRVSELTRLRRDDIDLENCAVRVVEGKGSKDRTALIPEQFRLPLAAYMDATADNAFLFETRRRGKYTPRRVQQIVSGYARAAGLEGKVYPHLLRHHALTQLARAGVADAKVQLVSGHANRQTLALYQSLALGDVRDDYEAAWQGHTV